MLPQRTPPPWPWSPFVMTDDPLFFMRYSFHEAEGGPIVYFSHPFTRWILAWIVWSEAPAGEEEIVAQKVCSEAAVWCWFGGAARWAPFAREWPIVTPKGKTASVQFGTEVRLYPGGPAPDILVLVSPVEGRHFSQAVQLAGVVPAKRFLTEARRDAGDLVMDRDKLTPLKQTGGR